jgi:predicted RNase H-like HicB family nuclease
VYPNRALAIFSRWDMLIRPRYFRKMHPGDRIRHPYAYMNSGRKPLHGIGSQDLRFTIETELETDGRWIAEIPQVPGALAYGATKEEAVNKAYAIALRSVADDVEHSDDAPPNSISWERHIA